MSAFILFWFNFFLEARAEFLKNFVGILVQMMTLKGHFEINWPLHMLWMMDNKKKSSLKSNILYWLKSAVPKIRPTMWAKFTVGSSTVSYKDKKMKDTAQKKALTILTGSIHIRRQMFWGDFLPTCLPLSDALLHKPI